MLRFIGAAMILGLDEMRQAFARAIHRGFRSIDGRLNPTRGQHIQEDPDRLGYHLMAGGSGAPPPRSDDPLLSVASEETWREIEREALS
jgi:hypothetical protein